MTNLDDWLNTTEEEVLRLLLAGNGPVKKSIPGATLVAFRFNAGVATNVTLEGTEASVDFPASMLPALNLTDAAALVTLVDLEVTSPIESVDDQGMRVTNIGAGLNVKLFTGQGAAVGVADLIEPVTLNIPTGNSSTSPRDCVFWDTSQSRFSSEGLVTLRNSTFVTCAATHLTFFAAIVRGFINALLCAQLSLLTEKGLRELLRGDWFYAPLSILFWLLLLALGTMFAVACIKDRARAREWSDDFFLLPQGEPPEEERLAGPRISTASKPPTWAEYVKQQLSFFEFGSIVRDAVDEIASRWFSCFGEAREMVESIFGGMTLEVGDRYTSRRARMAHALMSALMMGLTRRRVSASTGLSMDTVDLVTQDEDMRDFLLQAVCARSAGISDARMEAWLQLHMRIIDAKEWQLQRIAHWGVMPSAALSLFYGSNPISSSFSLCRLWDSSQRVLVFACELLGSFMIASVFFEASGGIMSKESSGLDCESEGIWAQVGQILLFAVASLVLNGLPVMILSSLRSRAFKKASYVGSPGWEKTLRSWRIQDRIFWCLGFCYCSFCIFFVTIFLANVSAEDHGPFGVSSAITLTEELLAIPLAIAVFVPLLALLSMGLTSYLTGMRKGELADQIRMEMEGKGTWYQIKTDI